MPVRGDGFLDDLAEPLEEAVIGGLAEIIRRQDDGAVEAEIEGGARQVNGFGQAGSAGTGEQAEVGKFFADADGGLPNRPTLIWGERRAFAGGAEDERAVTAPGGEKSQVRRDRLEVRGGSGLC